MTADRRAVFCLVLVLAARCTSRPSAVTPAVPQAVPEPSAVLPQIAIPATLPGEFPQPGYIDSVGGILTVNLNAAPGSVTIGGTRYPASLYNNMYIPPVWRVNPGDTIRLTLTNNLPNTPVSGMQAYTNLHYHGFNVSPKAPADDVFLEIYPQSSGVGPSSYQYTVPIATTHPEGLFWFHPHPHGMSEGQVLAGLSGTAIVNGLIPNYYPQFIGIEEKVFMLKDFCIDPPACDAPLTKTTNGMMSGTITIPLGSFQLWSFANIGADAFFDIMVADPNTGRPIPFWVIDVDGNPVWPAGAFVPRASLYLGAGGRMQALIQFQQPGIYQLWHRNVDTGPMGDANPSVLLGYVNVPPGNAAGPAPDVRTPQPARKDPRPTRAELRAGGKTYPQRTVVFSETADGNTFFIDGKTYDPTRIDTTIQYPAIEEWTITNTSGELHVFHIHQLDYLVEEINGVAQPDNGYQETITIPYAVNGVPGSVKVLIPFTDPVIIGKFVYHCHILGHEDAGMMANICVEQNAGDCATAAAATRMKHH